MNPNDFDGVLSLWLEGTPLEKADNFHVFAVGGFGTICAWGEKSNQTIEIDCIYGRCGASAKDFIKPKKADLSMESFLITARKDTFDTFGGEHGDELLFNSASKCWGALGYNEIYGFQPVLALGGQPKIENIRKVRADVHLALLREFGGPLAFPFW